MAGPLKNLWLAGHRRRRARVKWAPGMLAGVPLGRMTIGLYNSYDPVKFHEAHRRALARAGPIALAFDANLATFGFPYDKDLRTPLELLRWISGSTSIGDSGMYLAEPPEARRFQPCEFPKTEFRPHLGYGDV